MTALKVSIAPAAGVAAPPGLGSFFLDAIYSRSLNTETSADLTDLPSVVQDTARAALDGHLHGSLDLPDVVPSSSVDLCFLGSNGGVRLRKTVVPTENAALAVELSKSDVATITAPDVQPVPRNSRRAFFVPVTDQRVLFESSKLQIAPIPLGNEGWTQLGLDQLFHSDLAITTSVQWNGSLPLGLVTQPWAPFPLAADGQFAFSFPVNSDDAWLWWLSGPLSALGVVIDDLAAARMVRIGVGLPPFSGPAPSVDGQRAPFDVTEAQVATHPNIYTEDPGEFCKPFSNPERVLGERSFFVILRAEQPVISAEATVHKVPLPVMTYAPQAVLSHAPVSNNPVITGSAAARIPSDAAASATAGDGVRPAPGTLSDGTDEVIFVRHTIPTAYSDVLSRVDRGRTEMDAAHPMQWEDDSSRYQAVTVARGHILEFRMRWRSNGYSLGTVAKTLTLSPRQVRRIEKVEWRRSERSRREETTRLFDQVSDTLSRDRTYEDAVQANLSEWEHGDSHASMKSGAGGFGFAASGFVIGGGGGASSADSSSNQQAGRLASASEEQRLRDTIRRYGDALRKLDSLVVNEVTQEENATGTTEIVRNPNYGRSLTAIYYQILRHLKIETAIVGVRECLFVPFAISPFTVARAYRWRELIQAGMRDQQYLPAMRYLKDVLTHFAYSNVPVGRRSDQPVRYIHGSLFLRLGIERPVDKDDGAFNQAAWMVVRPYLGAPALSIYQRLKAIDETQRDIVFQQQHAGVIVASWVDTLLMDASGTPLHADFTLATRYQFNSTVRVDFSIQAPTGVTRETLANIRVRAGQNLPPGSVANLESMTFTYATDWFERTVSVSQGSGDLVAVETGVRDAAGATIAVMPDTWERTNVRAEMTRAVNDLLEHLNQHVEYYTKVAIWGVDRDRLWMMIDGFYVPGTNQVSIASVVERDPIAIIGNALVFRVSSGSFLGLGNIKTPTDLFNHYVSLESPSEPMLVSLPTDGLYAQTIMDECAALEEHFGNIDWVLNDPDPALGEIAPELLASRRAEPQGTQPTQLPQTIINLQNVPEAPAVSGLSGALSAVTNANSFRDMTGLAGTQANAASALQAAANLATNFGNQAAALKLAELAKDAHATQTADQKLATVQRALDKNLTTPDVAQQHTSQILDQLHEPSSTSPANQREAAVTQAVFAASASDKPFSVLHTTADGSTLVSLASDGGGGGGSTAGVSPTSLVSPFPSPIVLSRDMTAVIDCVEAAFQPANVGDLCGGLVDLTGDPTLPPYAGHNDTDMLYVGSLAKMYAMYVAFELRRRVTKHAKDEIKLGISPTTAAGVTKIFADLKTAWQPQLDATFPKFPSQFPDLAQIFTLAPDGEASFTRSDPPIDIFQIGEFRKVPPEAKFLDWMKLMMGFSNDEAAGLCIRALSYPYLNGVLGHAGFFHKSQGLWISGDYTGKDWIPNVPGQPQNQAGQMLTPRWAQRQGRTKSNFTGTVFQVARLVSALAQGVLVDPASCTEMIDDIMGVPFMQAALSTAVPRRPVTKIAGKVGIGDGDGGSLHDCAIITLDRGAKPALRFAAVVLGSFDINKMNQLEVAYYDCVVARNP